MERLGFQKRIIMSAFTVLFLVMSLCGCGSAETAGQDVHIDMANIDKVTFISFKDENGSKNVFWHKFSYDVDDFYKHTDYWEAAYRAYKNVLGGSAQYDIQTVKISIDDLISDARGHYVCVELIQDGELPYVDEEYRILIFDVETGDFWSGADKEHLSVYGNCKNGEYQADVDLLEYVEGKWPFREYGSFWEYLSSGDWIREIH